MIRMETSTEKVVRLLLLNPKKRWLQKDLAVRANCSKAFISKLMKKFSEKGIIARPYKNQAIMLSPTKLLNYWCSIRELPAPVYIKTKLGQKEIMKKLRKRNDYALTLFSAAWLRTKFMKTGIIELYVPYKGIKPFIRQFGEKSKSPTNFILFPSEKHIFEFTENICGLRTVSATQNYVDLMIYGSSGSRVAMKVAEKYSLL